MKDYKVNNSNVNKKGIYIHIPFCISKCIYCDFTSLPDCGDDVKGSYFAALKKEARLLRAEGVIADTLFIGGGTPSSVDAEHIAEVLSEIDIDEGAEVTIEMNPASVDAHKLAVYREAGINRVSMGVQSFNDDELRFLGRVHTADEAEASFRLLRECGFENINIDLIFGFPGQTADSWKSTLDRALALGPDHISFYSLQIEEETPLYEMFRRDEVDQIPDELNREMYHYASEIIKSHGYVHYEISNAALPGRECRHNMKYWTMEPYTGLGAAAHSFDGRCRFWNPDELKEYEAAAERKSAAGVLTAGTFIEENSAADSISDFIFTQLRLTRGLDTALFERLFGRGFMQLYSSRVQPFIESGHLVYEEGFLRFTRSGLDISNYIIGELL